jgi:CYTH domain-containing protein
MIEIENFWLQTIRLRQQLFSKSDAQGYLSSVPEHTVRVRIKGEKDIDHKGFK